MDFSDWKNLVDTAEHSNFLTGLGDDIRRRRSEVQKKIESMTGFDIDIWDPRSIMEAFDAVGLKYPYTSQYGGVGDFHNKWLEAQRDTVPRLLLAARKLEELGSLLPWGRG